MRTRLLLVLLPVLLSPSLAGCLGGVQRSEWAYDDAGLDAVRATGRSGRGVTIAILDTGVNTAHPALDHLVDGDRDNGELVAFRDFLGDAVSPSQAFDDDGHGSHVVGIVAARGTGGQGLLSPGVELRGGAPDALLVVGRVCTALCDPAVLPEAVRWAVDQGADVISMSLGGQLNLTDLQARLVIQGAIDEAIDAGVVVVASAGNRGPHNGDVEFPADVPGVISVGAIDSAGRVADFSSRGSPQNNTCRPLPTRPPAIPGLPPLPALLGRCAPDQKPEIVAPGVRILSAWAGQDYYHADGTSQATPFVTSAVALMLEGRVDLRSRADVEEVKLALVASAQPLEGQRQPHDDAAGYGALDALGALRAYGGA